MRMTTAYLDNTRDSLNNEAGLVGQMLLPDLAGHADQLQARVQQLGQSLSCRVTIVDNDGVVLADSEADPAHMENHRGRPEIALALAAGKGDSIRHSDTLGVDLLYLARTLTTADGKTYVVRLSVHLANLDRQLHLLYGALAGVTVLAIGVAAAIGFYFPGPHTAPGREVGDFAAEPGPGGTDRPLP